MLLSALIWATINSLGYVDPAMFNGTPATKTEKKSKGRCRSTFRKMHRPFHVRG